MARFGRGSRWFFLKLASGRSTNPLPKAPRRGEVSLAFESLEARQLLAADMAELLGTVRHDVQGDDNPANDQVVVGATVTLYRDSGNGAFDASDAAVGSPVDTDIFGKYRFNGLTAGKYFVKLELPPHLQSKSGGGVKEVNVTASEVDGEVGPTIDGFTTNQVAEAIPPLPSSTPSIQSDAAVMGGERDMFVELTSGSDIFSSVSLKSGGGLLRLASDTTVAGNAKLVWDGQDGSAAGVNPIGLGGLDFMSFNGNTMTGIQLAVGADHPNCVVKLRVYTDANHWTEYTTTVPETPGGAATKQVTFNFDELPSGSAGGGADFANVGAIELTFVGVSAVDGQVSHIGIVGLNTKTADFTAYSRISLGDRVWSDADNDGQLDSGEQGINGVKLNLYQDADGNNQYTSNVDVFVATTDTSAGGNYSFDDLVPGQYVVQVDPSNFQVGAALEGLNSSKGAAADPDNNVDNDDNGSPLAGQGVVSQAITLAAANMTVDFGFFGFDLVLDKSVQQTSVSPLETVTYTVKIDNAGPSTAVGVQFVDNLPTGATYKSHTVSKAGVTLSHSNGKLTGSLGNMAAGDVIFVTILVDVNATAVGALKNVAEVSAPDEQYTLNNRDEVENPITPKIDLQIDKIDSKDPVQPGETFKYTVTVKNNGPSNATGVSVVDTLPADVVYQGATRTGSVSGNDVTFAIGNLAAGETVSFEISVAVDVDFTGTLLNHVVVSGNETEITLANNQDAEQTLVDALPASISGYVYVDRNNNGVYESSEFPLGGVTMKLVGTDHAGNSVSRTTKTSTDGSYLFDDLAAGSYAVRQVNQPAQYRDGLDTLGRTFDDLGQPTGLNGTIGLDTVADDNRDAEAFEGIVLQGGYDALDYNFGELAVGVSKRDFVRPLFYQ